VVVALACAAPCAAAPTVMPGWPLPAAPGPVLQGPGPGAVVVSASLIDPNRFTVTAYRPNATRRWVNVRRAGCGNCDFGTQPVRRQADGTYGPIGVIGDDFWAVDQAGRTVGGCSGAVLPDGTCISVRTSFVASTGDVENALVSQRGAAVLWRLVEPGLGDWVPEGNEAPYVVRDGGGTVYTAYGQGAPQARLVAADGATGALRARVPGTYEFVAATADAGLARESFTGRLVAVGPDGAQRWSAALLPSFAFPRDVVVDRARARVFVGQTRSGRWRTQALDAATGGVIWTSPSSQSVRPLSLATGGLLLAGVEQGSSRSLRALGGADGRARWTFRTSGLVVGARELTDRTVAVSTQRPPGAGRGPLWRIRPG
jgi:outer membrane protein assembly factor BamB